mgnify:CR=1 FL=1
MWQHNTFLTLTYNDFHVPYGYVLDMDEITNFMRRMKYQEGPLRPRYFAAGEYGTKGTRIRNPHYHIIIFNYWPQDAVKHKEHGKYPTFTSESVAKLWKGKGFHSLAPFSSEVANYVCKYILKNQFLDESDAEYVPPFDPYTGEVVEIPKMRARMSTRPPIGKRYFDKYKDEIYKHDEIIIEGKPRQPPKVFDKWMAEDQPDLLTRVKADRMANAQKYYELQDSYTDRSHDTKSRRMARQQREKGTL